MQWSHLARRTGLRALALLIIAAMPAWAGKIAIDVAPDHADGTYQASETVTWTIQVTDDGQPAAGQVEYQVRRGGLVAIANGKLDLTGGQTKLSASLDRTGTLLAAISYHTAGGARVNAFGGAAFNLSQIAPSAPAPADFDQFWTEKLAELAAVPVNVKIEPVDIGNPAIEYAKITMDNIRGTKIYGQMAKPKGKRNLPAVLTVQWAGVYPLDRSWVVGEAQRGNLSLNVMAHDLPFDQPKAFYDELNRGKLKGYPHLGREDRETSYFLRMYLSCYRAADYLANHADWDRQTFLVQGGSQGGGQSIVAAGLHPAITAIASSVAAMCDHTGQLVGRAPGWPRLCGWGEKPDSEKALKTAAYFDAVNFARRVKAKDAIIAVGLVDTTCPPEGVIAMYNTLPCANKQLVIMPKSGHGGPGHERFYQAKERWLAKLLGK